MNTANFGALIPFQLFRINHLVLPCGGRSTFGGRLPRCCDLAGMVDRAATAASGCCGVARNPTGPDTALADSASPDIPLRVLKGGSFLCADNYCLRYRPAARIPQASVSGAVHIGFRCIRADQAAWFHATKRRRGDAMHRVLFAIHRKPELSFEEFVEHYREVHIPIARRLPRLRHYEIFPVVPAPDGAASSPDAFAIMTFDSAEDFEVVLGTPEMAEAVKDNETFIGGFETYVVDHLPVIPD